MFTPLFKNAFRMDTRRTRGDFLKFVIILLLAIFVILGSLTWASDMIAAQFAAIQNPDAIQDPDAIQNPINLAIITLIGVGVATAVSIFMGVLLTCFAFQRCNDIGISRLWVLVFGAGYTFSLSFSDQGMLVAWDSLNTISNWASWDSSGNIPSWVIWVAAIIAAPYVLFVLYLLFKPGQAKSNAFGPNPLSMSTAGASSKKAAPLKMAKKKARKKAGKKSAKKAAKKARS